MVLSLSLLALAPLPLPATAPSVLLAAVGDVMLARTVPGVIATGNPAWAWQKITPLLRTADLRFCNLECAVARSGTPLMKRYSFRADPARKQGAVLRAGHIDIVSLANNHSYDYGRDGLCETVDNKTFLHILAPGAGIGRAAAIAPRYVTRHRLKIAIVAYTLGEVPEKATCPPTAPCRRRWAMSRRYAAEVRAAKRGADVLVVSMHWGQEYSPAATNMQRRLAHLAIDAGADLILGAHPHVAEPVEIYHHRPHTSIAWATASSIAPAITPPTACSCSYASPAAK